MYDLSGKAVLVTGAAAGIGRGTAMRFADAGARVMVSDTDTKGGEETVDLIEGRDGSAEFFSADIADPKAVMQLVERTVEIFGRLDCACNNAGIEGKIAPLAEQATTDFDTVIAINMRGTFLCLRAEIAEMLKTGGGAIVNIASVAGLVGFPGLSPYVASKHAINGLTKNAALEYGKQGIRVNAVCPGGIQTRMLESVAAQSGGKNVHELMDPLHPIGRIGTPDEVADLVVWLCSPQAAFVCGAIIPVDGGYVAQ